MYQGQAAGTVDAPAFIISGEAEQERAVSRLADIFQWKLPLEHIHAHLTKAS